jgi:tetratricopeptide (TPR) repeat protein
MRVEWNGAVVLAVLCLTASRAAAERIDAGQRLEQALGGQRWEEVRAISRELASQERPAKETLLRAGGLLAERERYSEAAEIFRACVNSYPDAFEARYNLALADLALGSLSEALATLNGAARLSPGEEVARRYMRGKVLDALGRPDEAGRDLAFAFHSAPQRENYALDLGLFHLKRREYDKAAEVLQQAAKLSPASPYVLLELALAQVLGSTRSSGAETCRRLLQLQPAFSPAHLLLAYGLYMDGRFADSARQAEAGLAQPEPHPYLHYVHAAALMRQDSRDYPLLLRDLAAATRAIPQCSLCWFARAKVHESMGDEQAAIADLETLLRTVDPGFGQAWYRLAALYKRGGRDAEAAVATARFREIKSEETDRDAEMLRRQFVRGPEPANAAVGQGPQ